MGYIHEGNRVLNFVKGYTESDKQVTYICGRAFFFLPPPQRYYFHFHRQSPTFLSVGVGVHLRRIRQTKLPLFQNIKAQNCGSQNSISSGSWGKAGRAWSWSVVAWQRNAWSYTFVSHMPS